jgi:hypothetical protein
VQTWLYLPVSLRSTPYPPGMLIITAGVPRSDGHTLKKANYFREAIFFSRLSRSGGVLQVAAHGRQRRPLLDGRVNMESKL